MTEIRSRRVILMFDTEDGVGTYGRAYICDHGACDESFHVESFNSAKAAAIALSGWADVFLAIAEAEGEA